jgi:PPM family protein phosphatase
LNVRDARGEGACVEPHDEQSSVEQAPGARQADATPDLNGHAPQPGEHQAEDVSAVPVLSEPASPSVPSTEEEEPDTPEPSSQAGTSIGPYEILRWLEDRDEHPTYLAVLRESVRAPEDAEIVRPCYLLVESAPGEHGRASAVAVLNLHHPRLLAPRAVVAHHGRDYLAVEMVCDAQLRLPLSAAEGAHLSAEETLRAGVGLADALGYLHRNGVAHGHISPHVLLVLEGHAFLAGVEDATPIHASESSAALFARDANALAGALEALAGLSATSQTGELPDQEAVREIAARSLVGGFATAEDVGLACTQALDTTLPALSLGEEPSPSARLVLRAGSTTSVGRVRSQNQDAVSILHFDVRDDVPHGMPQGLFLVADGMGGEAHGELASRIASRVVGAELARAYLLPAMAVPATATLTDDMQLQTGQGTVRELAEALVRAVGQANSQVRALCDRLGQATGTTLTALAVRGTHAVLAHVGDSRAYLLHGESLMRLTEDHSLMARLEAMDHPLLHDPAFFMSRSILYRSLGQEEEAPPDLLDLPLTPGDRVLLCSDGLWDELDDHAIAATLATAADPETCARQLVDMANAAGGHDNSTALVLFVEELPHDAAADEQRDDLQDEPDEEPEERTEPDGADKG